MTQVKSRDTMRDSARLAIMARIGSANSLYEVFSFADRAIYPESGDPARLRVLSVFGPVVAECVNFDRRTVIDHWRTIWHVINGKDRASQLAGFLGCSVG